MVAPTGYAEWTHDLKRALLACRLAEARAKSSGSSFFDCMQYGQARLILHRVRIGLTPQGRPRRPAPDWNLEEHYAAIAVTTVHIVFSIGALNQIMETG